MKNSSPIILTVFLLLLSCDNLDNQPRCFLNFKLGMLEGEYIRFLKKYSKQGVLEVRDNPYSWNKRTVIYTFKELNIKALMEPIFITNRMDVLRLFIGGGDPVLNYNKATIREYDQIIELFKSMYGDPTEEDVDFQESGHKTAAWEKRNFSIRVVFSPKNIISENQIGIYFDPSPELEDKIRKYSIDYENHEEGMWDN